jgi:acetoin utilization deacetylase AcuC-like enzyme
MRPPGHHATADQAMGFCYLNQVAIAALAARRDLGVERVAVWDFDAHHGNGTEAILQGARASSSAPCTSPRATRAPACATKATAATGRPPGSPRVRTWTRCARRSTPSVAFRPDLVLVSAGFDAYARDPITEMTLEAEDFARSGGGSGRPACPRRRSSRAATARPAELVAAFLAEWASAPRP